MIHFHVGVFLLEYLYRAPSLIEHPAQKCNQLCQRWWTPLERLSELLSL